MSAAEKGLTIVQPAEPPAIAPVAVDWDEQRRLFRQMVARNATDAEVDAIVVTCQQLGFVPVLRQVDLIDHQVYINHKGLWHLAHRSGMLNGIEVLEQGETDTHYTAQVAIYRKDMRYPFTYRGRYPKQGRNKQYGEEMALTRAECHALRRAFNVSLPVSEEINWSVDAEGQRFVRDLEVVDVTDQGRPGRAAAQLPAAGQAARVAQAGEPAAPAAEAGEIPQELGWTPFWAWAKDRGLKTRDDIDRAAGVATIGMVPAQIKRAILAKAPGSEKRPLTADETLEWLGAQERPLKAQERACKHLFSLSEDRAELEAWYATAQVLCHQDAVDGAWFDRTTDLGWHTEVVPAMEEEEPGIFEEGYDPEGMAASAADGANGALGGVLAAKNEPGI